VGARKKKNVYINKIFCVYFTHLPRSPPWRNLHKILHDGSPPRRNQPCQILSQSGQGFWFCGGSNFWIPHKIEKSPLTQGLNYRSACDVTGSYVKVHRGKCPTSVPKPTTERQGPVSWEIFVAPGKFFPPPYCHNVTNANVNPNPNINPKFNPILNLNSNPYCCVWE